MKVPKNQSIIIVMVRTMFIYDKQSNKLKIILLYLSIYNKYNFRNTHGNHL